MDDGIKLRVLKIHILQGKFWDWVLDQFSKGTPIKVDGFTLGPFILIRRGKLGRGLLAHEIVHYEQWRRGWYIGFMVKYWYYHIKKGYHSNPYEVEAYQLQRDLLRQKIAQKVIDNLSVT